MPSTVILKERNPQKADDYENEIDTYRHLQSLQGTLIPRMFGEVVSYPHVQTRYRMSKRPIPAILLEYVEGVPLHSLPPEELKDPRLFEQLRDMYSLLTENGVVHGDPHLHNFLRVEQRVMAIDFEFSHLVFPEGESNEDELLDLQDQIHEA